VASLFAGGPAGKPFISVLSSFAEVEPFVTDVQRNADLEKDALGFLPASVYDDAARRGSLLVATCASPIRAGYAGHLLFGGRFPHARVFQIFVAARFRKQGVGRELIKKLVAITEGLGFLSISARVAADLVANGFWNELGFDVAGTKPGGPARNRTINLRVRQLNTRHLFSSLPPATHELGLIDRLASRQAVYVIDLNVFWDVVKGRPRSEYAAGVVSAALHQLVCVVVTSEFVKELQRTSRPEPRDPALEFAMQMPTLPEPEALVLDPLIDEIGKLVFPARASSGSLSARDRSDLTHLAIAIHHSANAFVTSENAILQAGDSIYGQYGVEVLHVETFSSAVKNAQKHIPAFRAQLSSATLNLLELVADNVPAVELFLRNNSAPSDYRDDFLAAGAVASARKRMWVASDAEIVCLASWDSNAGLQPRASVRLIADEEHPAAETALDCIINRICTQASRVGPVLLRLSTPPGHAVSRKAALLHGFRPPEGPEAGDGTYLQKLAVGRPITNSNWSRVRTTLQQCSGLCLPQAIPAMGSADQEIAFTSDSGPQSSVSLFVAEGLLSPTLIVGPGRGGTVVPIRWRYAEQLLQASPQLLLAPSREASLFSDRVYFSSARNVRVLSSGTPLLFYESGGGGGRAAVTAVARVTGSEVHSKADVSAELLRHGVLDSQDLVDLMASGFVAVTTFDNVMAFERPVRLDRLRQIGCVDGSNLVTARPITHEQLVTILEEGFSLG
jgi:GNAT superfamily N-acetyltransferase/predicted nucleic acid-binding protein